MEAAVYDPALDGTSRAAAAEEARWRARPGQLEARRGAARAARAGAEVWTKEPHGGAYRRAGPGAAGGYDALEQRPDGSARECDLGFEKPASGPTTNFVGNHMTQGAIDLVQAQLARRDPRQEEAAWRRYMHTYHPPKRIAGEAAAAAPPEREVPRFRWRQEGGEVLVTVPLGEMGDTRLARFAATVEVERGGGTGEIGSDVLRLRVLFEGPPARAFGLRRRLWAPLQPGPEAMKWEVHGGSNSLRIRLRKADPGAEWPDLEPPAASGGPRASAPLRLTGNMGAAAREVEEPPTPTALVEGSGGAPPPQRGPDLAALRWAIREGRRAKQSGDGVLYRPLEEYPGGGGDVGSQAREGMTASIDGGAGMGAGAGTGAAPLPPEELVRRGREACAGGRWSEALDLFTSGAGGLSAAAAAEAHTQMAECHAQLGAPRAAVEAAAEAVRLCELAGGLEHAQPRARLRRALALEELESFSEAAADFRWVSAQASAPAEARAAREGLARATRGGREAARLAADAAAAAAQAPPPTAPAPVPHAGHPQFLPRGKAGAPF